MTEGGRYGDRDDLSTYNSVAKWKELLDALVENHVARETEDLKGAVLVNDMRGYGFLHRLRLLSSSLQKLRGLQQVASFVPRG